MFLQVDFCRNFDIFNLMQNIKKLPKTVPSFLWHYIKQYKLVFFSCLTLRVFSAAIEVAIPYVTKLIIEVVEKNADDLSNLWSDISGYFWISVGLTTIIILCHRVNRIIEGYNMPAIQGRIKLDLFSYIQNHSFKYFADNFAGAITNKFNDIINATRRMNGQIIDIICGFVSFLLLAGIFFKIAWWFSAWFMIWVVIHLTLTVIGVPKWNKSAKIAGDTRSKTTGKVVDSITNNINVKMFSGKKYEYENLKKHIDQEIKDGRKSHIEPQKTILMQSIMMLIFIDGGMFFMQIYSLANGYISISDFVFILIALAPIGYILFYMTFNLAELMYEHGTMKQALETITVPHSVRDLGDAKTLNIHDASINMDNISFGYNENKNIFTNLSMVIPEGQKVGIVGHSGAGKSTLSQLLLRYYDVDSGKIYIGGEDIAKVDQDSLRQVITMVPQDTSLFHRSIIENIKYGNPTATDEEVVEASKKAKADEFIISIPGGYHALVGERGIKLSVGQRQRIAIARAILKDAPIVIMDEATSALDSETEKYIQESMENLLAGKTAIVIAHRLSTLKAMDRLIVMRDGQIVEDGTHNELISAKGYYYTLYTMQNSGFLGGKSNKHSI